MLGILINCFSILNQVIGISKLIILISLKMCSKSTLSRKYVNINFIVKY